ncbi:MAG: ribonuclease P protein component [Lachnospiraceae bacterium]|nr:ribonuclease P protein component [Lachnospiraceae bacterium]
MINTLSLRNSSQFSNVFKNGRSKANKYLIVYILENNQPFNRFGISVSKKVGNSVIRHRVKRLIKESYRLQEKMFNSGLDIAVIARGQASSISYEEMESALLHLLKLHKIMK